MENKFRRKPSVAVTEKLNIISSRTKKLCDQKNNNR
jgi:hypothetical protein